MFLEDKGFREECFIDDKKAVDVFKKCLEYANKTFEEEAKGGRYYLDVFDLMFEKNEKKELIISINDIVGFGINTDYGMVEIKVSDSVLDEETKEHIGEELFLTCQGVEY